MNIRYLPFGKLIAKWLDLEDTPSSYSGQDGKVPAVKATEDGLEFVDRMTNPMTTAEDLIKGGVGGIPERLAKGTEGQVLQIIAGALAWGDVVATFLGLTDTPSSYSGQAGKAAVVKSTEDGLEFAAPAPKAHKTSHQDGGADEISIEGLAGVPAIHKSSVRAYQSDAHQTIPSGSWTILKLNSESWDELGEFDNTSGNYKFTAQAAGKYLVVVKIFWNQSMSGIPTYHDIYKNGNTEVERIDALFNDNQSIQISVILKLEANDYIQVRVYQNSGSDKLIAASSIYTNLEIQRLA